MFVSVCQSVDLAQVYLEGMTFTVPISSNSHEVIPIPIPTHSHDNTLFRSHFLPTPLFTIAMPIDSY